MGGQREGGRQSGVRGSKWMAWSAEEWEVNCISGKRERDESEAAVAAGSGCEKSAAGH